MKTRRALSHGMVPLMFAATFTCAVSTQAHAQADWGKWEDAVVGGGSSSYPGGQTCSGAKLSGKHAYWTCVNRCGGVSGGWCWEAHSDEIYTCPEGSDSKGYRRLEKVRYTKIPCGPEDWKATKHLAELYKETWTQKITEEPPPVGTPTSPPVSKDDLPPSKQGDDPPSWGGDPPWAPKEAEKTDTKTTDTDKGKTETVKTDVGKTATGKSDAGKTNKRPRKETKKKSRSRNAARSHTGTNDARTNSGNNPDVSPAAIDAIGIGVGIGLGVGGRRGGDRRENMMRDRNMR